MTEPKDGSPQPPQRAVPRIFPRYPIDLRVQVTVDRPEGARSLRGRSTDLSESGMAATLAGELQPGESVHMEFTLPLTKAPLRLRAVVRRRNGLHYGFEFHSLSAQQRQAIRRVCDPLSPEERL